MWMLLNLLFLAILFLCGLGLALLAWTAVLGLLFAVWRRKKIFLWIPLGAVIYVVGVGGFLWHEWSPPVVFKREFGFAPPPDVAKLNSSTFILGDGGSVRLTFDAAPSTIAQIVQAKGLTTPPDNFDVSDRPTNWLPTGVSYTASGRGSFAQEHRQLWYDPTTGHAWYEYVGID